MTEETNNESTEQNSNQPNPLKMMEMMGISIEDISRLVHSRLENETLSEREERIYEQAEKSELAPEQIDRLDAVTQLVISDIISAKVTDAHTRVERGEDLNPAEAVGLDVSQNPAVPGLVAGGVLTDPRTTARTVAQLHAVLRHQDVYDDLDVDPDPELSTAYRKANERLLSD